jgi:hypothetical protein
MSARNFVWPQRQDWTAPTVPPPPPPGFNRRAAALGSLAAMLVAPALEAASAAVHPDAELLRLIGEFNDLEREANSHFAQELTGEEERARDAEIIDPLRRRQTVLLDQIVRLRASTLVGLFARIEMFDLYTPDEDNLMICSIVRDAAELKAGGLA